MRWIPLESDPEIMTTWSESLGLDTKKAVFTDILGFDEELLAMVPQPVYAVVLLFPMSKAYEEQCKTLEKSDDKDINDMLYFKQTIGNACGTMGLLHAIANGHIDGRKTPILEASTLEKLFERCKDLTPIERAKELETNDEVAKAHTGSAKLGQTAAPDASAKVDLHFLAFVASKNNRLVELDGAKSFPVDRGPIKKDLLYDTVRIIKEKFLPLSDDPRYNAIALSSVEDN